MIGSFNSFNLITLSHNATTSDVFKDIHWVFLDVIGYNKASLDQYGKYGTINTTETPTKIYYVIKFFSEAYTLQDDTTCDGQISSDGELIVKA